MYEGSTILGFTPTTQRYEGYPYGECVRASYATILDLPLDAVPRFDPAALRPGEDQKSRECRWLASLGLGLVEIIAPPDEEIPQEVLDEVPPVEHLISGRSPRGFGHRCVGWGGRVLFDPHPSQDGLEAVYAIGFLVPL